LIGVAILCSPIAWYQYAVMIAPFFVARRWDKISNLARSASSFQASFQGSPWLAALTVQL
jgi:hypothetical protein